VARILAKALNCEKGPSPVPCNECASCVGSTKGHAVDVFEIDGASNNGVEQVRELRENVKYLPARSRFKIYIIDEVHMLSLPAFNALLKTLEEPPAHVMFMFATTEPHKIPITILSRCQRHDFRRIDAESITAHLKTICRQEAMEPDDESLWLIAREAAGSMRDALSLLDQVMTCSQGVPEPGQISDILGVIDRKAIFDLSSAILARDAAAILRTIDDVYDRGLNLKKLYADLLTHFRNLLVAKLGRDVKKLVDLPGQELTALQQQAEAHTPMFLNQVFDMLYQEEGSVRYTVQPRLVLEMMFLRLAQLQPALSIDVLIEKLDRLRKEMTGAVQKSSGPAGSGGPPPPESDLPSEGGGPQEAESRSRGRMDDASDLHQFWEALLERIAGDHPAFGASLKQAARLLRLGEKRVEIEIQGNGFSRALVQRRKNRGILRDVLQEALGRPVEVRIRAAEGAETAKVEKKNEIEQRKREALNHPLVADAVEIFDGKIVDVKLLQEVDQ
jgi:DNA polymerase-3 subunit gamma/tau